MSDVQIHMSSVLSSLAADQREVLVSLPYRVGVMVSMCDQSGGDAASQKEMQALSNILDGFTHQVFGSELLQYVMQGTLDAKDRWPEWRKNLGSVYKECQKAIQILHSVVDEKETNAYCLRLMEIAEVVALAFREDEDMTFSQRIKVYIYYLKAFYKAKSLKQPYKSFDEYLRISSKERVVLRNISKALGAPYII